MPHLISVALALILTLAVAGDAAAAQRINFSPAKFFCSLAREFCPPQRKRAPTKKVVRKPAAPRAPAVAKAQPAPETARAEPAPQTPAAKVASVETAPETPAAVVASVEPAPETPTSEVEEVEEAEETSLSVPIPVPRPARQAKAIQTASLLIPFPPPRPVLPPAGEAGAPAPPAEAAAPFTMPDRQKSFERREAYRKLARAEAQRLGLPFPLVDAVMKVESGYDPGARGTAGEVGLMQVMPETASLLGFRGTAVELKEPYVNISLGTTYLARAWSLAKKDVCTTVMKYRAGHGESRFSELSVRYCQRVRAHLLASGYPVTRRLPKVDLLPEPEVAATEKEPVAEPERERRIPEFAKLAEFGEWVPRKEGAVWVPRNMPEGWRPYTVGRWAFTRELGWVWVSDEPFGWATYHYGRWDHDEDLGWHWVEGDQWAPAWVAWRRSTRMVAWAPLPPLAKGAQASEGVPCCPVPEDRWTAVPIRNFLNRNLSEIVVPEAIEAARPLGAVRVENGAVVNKAFDVALVEKQIGGKVRVYDIRLTDDSAETASGLKGELVLYRPAGLKAAAADAPPQGENAQASD
jgi:hypothetical protein